VTLVRAAGAWLLVVLLGGVGGCRDAAAPDAASAKGGGVSDTTRRREFWAIYARASEARSAGRLDEAVQLYTQALTLNPAHEDALYYLGNCHLERRQFTQALDAYQRLVALNPSGSSRAHMQLGSIRASLEPGAPVDLDEAAAHFQHALDVDPESGALLGLAEVALLEGKRSEAERLLAQVERDNPMSVAAPYLRGYLAFERGAGDTAWTLFSEAVARGVLKKGGVKWTEEGDVKGTPELRWRALARQSVFGPHWIRLRTYLAPPGPTRRDMRTEYGQLRHIFERRPG
jgi:tetratricopeptide (TPR) repeat protein